MDAVRPAGVSSTDAELALALERARAVVEYLTSVGWPAPIQAMSGNGYHLLHRIDLPTDDGGLVKFVLAALAERFSDDAVAIDRAVHNPARIAKVVGTVSRKATAPLRKWFSKVAYHRGKKTAIVALARKLLTIAYRLLRDETVYDAARLRKRAA